MKRNKYKIKKANNGIRSVDQEFLDYKSDIQSKQQLGSSLATTVADSFLPGSGTAIGLVDGISKSLTKDQDGIYKNKTSKVLDNTLNPLKTVNAIASGNTSDIVDSLTFGVGSDIAKGLGINLGGSSDDKLKKLKKEAQAKQATKEFNDSIDNVDPTSMQRTQIMKKGGSTKSTKVIEIEGKVTPEIHTDKNFNIKNLGSIPHSKGGNKVLATEGDVVFPTQDSPTKFNKVMTAIKKKDISTLKKEQSKLPEDTSPTYQDGTKKVETKEQKKARIKREQEEFIKNDPLSQIIEPIAKWFTGGYKKSDPTKRKVNSSLIPKKDKPSTTKSSNNKGIVELDKVGEVIKPTPNVKPTSNTTKKSKPIKPVSRVKTNIDPLQPNLPSLSSTSNSRPDKLNSVNMDSQVNTNNTNDKNVKSLVDSIKGIKAPNVNTALEALPVAYNIGQGLFGKVDKVNRRYYNPTLEGYTDLSNPLRSKSNSIYSQDKSNSRNLSSGVAANSRANQQAASNTEFNRQSDINSQEIARQDNINNRNTQIKNQAANINLQLDNQYDEIDAANRGAKSNLLSQGLTDLGAIGSRNLLQKNERETNATMVKAGAMGTMYEPIFNKDGVLERYKFKGTPQEEIDYINKQALDKAKKKEETKAKYGIKKIKTKGKK